MSDKSAPGASSINYKWFKVLNQDGIRIMCWFAEICFRSGQFPKSWSDSQLYPIPKHSAWEGDVRKTRPIILLECLRKIYMRMITKRIQKICQQWSILQGYNFCGMPHKSTM